jgi:BASS family bile acid:Na+ symporter
VPVIAAFVIQTVLVPVTTGIAISTHWPQLADSAAPLVRRVSLVILIPVALLMLARFAGNFADSVGDGTLAAIAAVVAVGIAAGYAFGGPDPASREALGDAAATRHPGLAATIAQLNSSDDRVLTAIVLYLFASIGFSLVYAWLISRAKALPIKGGERPHP